MFVRRLVLLMAAYSFVIWHEGDMLFAQQGFAIGGNPLGIGYLELKWDEESQVSKTSGTDSVLLSEASRRVFYPAVVKETVTIPGKMRLDPAPRELKFGQGRIIERLGQVFKAAVTTDDREEVVGHAVWFIFRGTEPIELTIRGPKEVHHTMQPEPSTPEQLEAAKLQWWQAYEGNANNQIKNSGVPPVIEAQLLSMLSRRLGLPKPDSLSRLKLGKLPDPLGTGP